jgi:hypothetical protein
MTNSFLCLHEPTRILWTSTSCQIGLAFGPMFQFKALGQQLVKHSEFSGIYGKQLELFFQSEEDIYYAGTYHCQGLPENPQGCLRTDVKVGSISSSLLSSNLDIFDNSPSNYCPTVCDDPRRHYLPSQCWLLAVHSRLAAQRGEGPLHGGCNEGRVRYFPMHRLQSSGARYLLEATRYP